ncbi:MAG TPA: hypothetical protein VKU77_35160 [Streptosporangiaceae bacterium]|nr:hypothetical protein [Streptosporangiaceae bacterium]
MPGQEIVVPRAQDEPGESNPRRSNWTWADRPVVPGAIALLAALAFVLARLQVWAKGDISRFILVGRHFATVSQLPPGVAVSPTYGYDGQFYYRLALNPGNFSHIAYGIRLDQPYRFMRIGYPWLTWLISVGQHVLVPVMLVVVNVVAIGAIGYLGGVFARQGGRHALAGLVLPAYFGLLTSVSRDTAEPFAAVCLLGGLLAVRARRPVLAGLLLACGALSRETVMVAVAALFIIRVAGAARGREPARPLRADLAWVLPTVVFVAWEAIVKVITGSIPVLTDSDHNADLPFVAPLEALRSNLHHLNLHPLDQYTVWFLEIIILALFALAALLSWRSTNAPVHERLALVLYMIEICVVTPNTWGSLDADLRSFIEVYLMAAIILLGTPLRRLRSWLPYLGPLLIAALIVVTQRRVTLS